MLKYSGSIIWRLGFKPTLRYSGTSTVYKTDKKDAPKPPPEQTTSESDSSSGKGLVAAAFASLNDPTKEHSTDTKKPSLKSTKQSRTQQIDGQIMKATDVNSLLVFAESPIVSRRHALKMVSILSDWSTSNKVKLTDFEKDPRFLKLCRILARTHTAQAMSSLTMAEDLSTVLGITGDDEAARLITNLTLPQMVKVMKALYQKGRRSTPLLRALAHNITKQPDVIDIKKSADLLFSMAALNFPDPVLLDRICNDILETIHSHKDKSAVVNSIVVSLGLLKYRHEQVLSAIVDWMTNNKECCRASDIASTVVTLATVDFIPMESEELFKIATALKEDEIIRATTWLDLVFSLLILNKAEKHHLVSTLRPDFIDKLLSSGEISIPVRRKLMSIDAYLSLTDPSSPRLDSDISVGVPIVYTKEKELYVLSILDTFKNFVSADSFLKKLCNSEMGFLYDAEFAVDSKCNPVPLEKAKNDKSVHRIAVLGFDYHDMTRKTILPLGINRLHKRLLELKGYKVLTIPYTEFNVKDKLITRVQYIEKKLRTLISNKEQ